MTLEESRQRDVNQRHYRCGTCKWWSDELPDEKARKWQTEGWCSHPPKAHYGAHQGFCSGHCAEYETATRYTGQTALNV